MADSIPWEPFNSANHSAASGPSAFVKRGIPYREKPNALQNLDVWLPNRDNASSIPPDSWPVKADGLWIIYIHGGAWRDPAVAAWSFNSPASYLLEKERVTERLGGLASLNYTLSPHPKHATDPSPPTDPSKPADPSRMGRHPDHLLDILAALEFLQKKFGFTNNYILTGHSCGATLTFQVAMDRKLWGDKSPSADSVPKPKYILGLNGLYDMPNLVYNPGKKHEDLQGLYQFFTQIAFSENEEVWKQISPTYVENWASVWPEAIFAGIVQSKQDNLVPYEQTEDMLAKFNASKSAIAKSQEFQAGGDHNELWQYGERLADILEQMIAKVTT